MSSKYQILDQNVTIGNFGDWSKAYVQDLTDTLQGKFNEGVATETASIQDMAQQKISSANQEAQLAFEEAQSAKSSLKTFLILGAAAVGAFYFYKKGK